MRGANLRRAWADDPEGMRRRARRGARNQSRAAKSRGGKKGGRLGGLIGGPIAGARNAQKPGYLSAIAKLVSRETRSRGAKRANHNRHHRDRGVLNPACELCRAESRRAA